MTDAGKIPQAAPAKEAADRAANAFDVVAAWVLSRPMADLLSVFGEDIDAGAGLDPADLGWLPFDEDLPAWLDELLGGSAPAGPSAEQLATLRRVLLVERAAARHFNFRARPDGSYRERAEIGEGTFEPDTRERVTDLARRLGLVDAQDPRYTSYDHTLVLGGGYRSPLLRAQFAAEVGSTVDLGLVSLLGSPRFLLVSKDPGTPPERETTDEYAPGATDEFDLMVASAQVAMAAVPAPVEFLCGCPSATERCPRWRYDDPEAAAQTPPEFTHERRAELTNDRGRFGQVLSASTGRPPYRPDTADTFRLWARLVDPRPGVRVLSVTTQVFVPFQTFDGLRRLYLPYGVDLDVVGMGVEYVDRPHTAEYLLQETLSGIRSARRLLVAATDLLLTG